MNLLGHEFSFSNALALVRRELRAESRRPVNYALRVVTALVVTVFAGFTATTDLDTSMLGAALFDVLRKALWLAMWIIVPMMTADCVSREKREGTLGLLFLTPLMVLDVLLGKAASHILRATTLLLASMPVLVLPFVLGGVEWTDALLALAAITNALLLGIAAGIYASAKGGSAIQVMVMAEFYALVLAGGRAMARWFSEMVYGSPPGELRWLLVITNFGTVAMFVMVIEMSIRMLKKTWDQDDATPEQPKWTTRFSDSEFWRAVFHWNRGRALDRNPMAWLQEYSWTARLTKWGWCLFMLAAEFFTLFEDTPWQPQLTTIMSLGVAFSATGSFRRERQTGLLEVLLVAPLSVRQLVAGRLWGIFSHFCPALAVLLVCWNGDQLLNHHAFHANPFQLVIPNPLTFLALMVVGLYLSLWRLNLFVAWFAAWVLAFFIPTFAGMVLARFQFMHLAGIVALTSAGEVVLTVVCWFLLCRNMEQRKFVTAGPA